MRRAAFDHIFFTLTSTRPQWTGAALLYPFGEEDRVNAVAATLGSPS